ncbi:hypothetical protein [Acidithrix ferrooxidans]|uniref:hypothetical protein n=1 Tax=Acidithrix ferrooxidans TaxID=1280514 RepID=UPI0006977580|nr:hypothetical protein [Acidithrix ferrooxidans]
MQNGDFGFNGGKLAASPRRRGCSLVEAVATVVRVGISIYGDAQYALTMEDTFTRRSEAVFYGSRKPITKRGSATTKRWRDNDVWQEKDGGGDRRLNADLQ